jgi:hypothetical protein
VLSVSKFGNMPYFLGKTVFDFVTGRRGMDINQPSRLATYSQLKLLLALNNSMEPALRSEVSGRLESISVNPFENGINAEANIALEQYAALVAFAKDPKGLAARIEQDRRAEMLPLEHGSKAQIAFRVLNVLTFGKYVHREEPGGDMKHRLDIARSLQYHTRFLEQIARSSAEVDITWNLNDVKRSLQFIADHGEHADGTAAAATARIFARTKDNETRLTCLDGLARIRSSKARNELLRISKNTDVDQTLRDLASEYLRGVRGEQPIAVTTLSGTPMAVGQP